MFTAYCTFSNKYLSMLFNVGNRYGIAEAVLIFFYLDSISRNGIQVD
jgi:hypothetical protein